MCPARTSSLGRCVCACSAHAGRFESCWPAAFKGCHGAVFVYDPSQHSLAELDPWCGGAWACQLRHPRRIKTMIKLTELRSKQCIVFSNLSGADAVADETDKPCARTGRYSAPDHPQPRSWPSSRGCR